MSQEHAILAGAVGANQSGTLKMILVAIGHFFGIDGKTQVGDAIDKVQGAGVTLITIITALLPLVLSLFSGQKIDLQTIINAILALIPKSA